MSVINSQPLIGASGNQGGAYNIERSLRFRSSASAFLNRTPASASDRQKFTWSGWVKRGSLNIYGQLFSARNSDSANFGLLFWDDNTLYFADQTAVSTYGLQFKTTQVFRDPSAWYHIIVAIDTTQATNTNRVKLYVNGTQVSAFSTATYPSQNTNTFVNTTNAHNISAFTSGSNHFDGYLSEVNFVDGQALTPSSFGETDTITGVWKPKAYAGTYGTNGFYLKFNTLTSTSTLGNDSSGNSNTWTVNNVSLTTGATYDSMTDVPTLTSATAANYAVLNPLNKGSSVALASANLNATSSSTYGIVLGTIGVASGKFYWEVLINSSDGANTVGIGDGNTDVSSYLGKNNNLGYTGSIIYGPNDTTTQSGLATFTTNDIIGVALNMDASEVKFYKNNSLVTTVTGLSATSWFPAVADNSGSSNLNVIANFGQRPFAYTPPSGFVALNTFNLPTSTIVAGNTVMDVNTWTGNGSTQTITNAGGFRPDLVWYKSRSNSGYDHYLEDSVRGATKWLGSSSTGAEQTIANSLTSFNSNGFSLGSDAGGNQNTLTYVGWQWQAGQGTNVTNTAGSITSTVSANPSAGFSVVTWTGTGSGAATVGHGLGVAPKFIITKPRGISADWICYNENLGNNAYLVLNSSAAQVTGATTVWGSTSPTSTVFSLGTGYNYNTTMVAYCWAEVAGFSKFGSYTGNGSTDGVFVYTGFRPKWIMFKRTDSAAGWLMLDSSRNTFNVLTGQLYANASDAEATGATADFLSNGIKIRETGGGTNASGGSYVFACFAENPFKNSLAR